MSTDCDPPARDAESRYPLSWSIFGVARSHRALAAALLAPLGLYPGQELMLMALFTHDGRSQRQLGDLLRLDHSTVAKSVQRLERAGLITRSRSAIDGRVTLVHLTDRGRDLEQPVRRAWAELERRTTETLTRDQQQSFVYLTAQVARNVEQ